MLTQNKTAFIAIVGLIFVLSISIDQVGCQIFDQLFNRRDQLDNQIQVGESVGVPRQPSRPGTMSVQVPIFYEMFKNSSSMGINVLSGLVKIERGDEASRSGLRGPRPLSVRIFGIPVYERGTRISYGDGGYAGKEPEINSANPEDYEPKVDEVAKISKPKST